VIHVHTVAKTCLCSCDRNKFVYKSWIIFWKNESVSFLRNKFVYMSWVSFRFIQVYWTKCVLEFLWYPRELEKLISDTNCTTQTAHWWSGLWKKIDFLELLQGLCYMQLELIGIVRMCALFSVSPKFAKFSVVKFTFFVRCAYLYTRNIWATKWKIYAQVQASVASMVLWSNRLVADISSFLITKSKIKRNWCNIGFQERNKMTWHVSRFQDFALSQKTLSLFGHVFNEKLT
jgi:hypothetical protein